MPFRLRVPVLAKGRVGAAVRVVRLPTVPRRTRAAAGGSVTRGLVVSDASRRALEARFLRLLAAENDRVGWKIVKRDGGEGRLASEAAAGETGGAGGGRERDDDPRIAA